MRLKLLTVAVAASLLAACSDDDNSHNNGNAATGVFLDSAVSGISYKGSESSGITGANGEYNYKPGETITFSIGGVTLGSAKGTGKLLLKDLDNGLDGSGQPNKVSVNRAIFLQTLDEDGDASNGIQISATTRDKLKSAVVGFNQDSSAFVTALATALGTAGIDAEPVPADEALDHMLQTEAETNGGLKVTVGDGVVDSIQRFVVPDNRVPYTGNDAGLKKIFPKGFPLAVGSGLAFYGKSGSTLTF
ncbi:MAG TPA: hypothetical protein VF050_11605, partial [Moraxellaceae bacterium]